MSRRNPAGVMLLASLLVLALVGSAASQLKRYEGEVAAVNVEECQLMPGTCKGTITLAFRDGTQATLSVDPETVMVRGDRRISLSEVAVGNYVMVRAEPVPGGARGERIMSLTEKYLKAPP